jgi:hypothetical protein
MRDVLIKVGMTAAAIAVFSLLVFSKDAAVQLGVLLTLAQQALKGWHGSCIGAIICRRNTRSRCPTTLTGDNT